MDIMNIRKVTLDDIEQLQQIVRQTFSETFSSSNAEENMATYLEEGFYDKKLIKELNNKSIEFYVALSENEVNGHLKINFKQSQTKLQDDTALEIERIYVKKEFHGKKMGQILYDKAIEIAKKK